MNYKLPISVLVIVHTAEREVLLLERSLRRGYWQSVTGSVDRMDEPLEQAGEDEAGSGRQGRRTSWFACRRQAGARQDRAYIQPAASPFSPSHR